MNRNIPVSEPFFDRLEAEYVNDAVRNVAISGLYGEYLKRFEDDFSNYCGCRYGVSTTSGTASLHLAVAVLGIGKGDEVLVSTLTNMATFFAVIYQGAIPIPIDVESDTLNLDPTLLEAKITDRTRAIIVVHLFGHPVDMNPVMQVAEKHHLRVIEDCAQAHGATYLGKKVGGIGDIGCFSFYANKIITTGEGGMLTTNNPDVAEKARSLKSLAFGDANKFMHRSVGFNYRMTNLQAALGCAQLEKIEAIIKSKRRIARFYNEAFEGSELLQLPVEKSYARNVYWMYHIVLRGKAGLKRDAVMQKLQECRIETREGFIPYNMQEIFLEKGWAKLEDCPKANEIALRSFYLPSGPSLSQNDLEYTSTCLENTLKLL